MLRGSQLSVVPGTDATKDWGGLGATRVILEGAALMMYPVMMTVREIRDEAAAHRRAAKLPRWASYLGRPQELAHIG